MLAFLFDPRCSSIGCKCNMSSSGATAAPPPRSSVHLSDCDCTCGEYTTQLLRARGHAPVAARNNDIQLIYYSEIQRSLISQAATKQLPLAVKRYGFMRVNETIYLLTVQLQYIRLSNATRRVYLLPCILYTGLQTCMFAAYKQLPLYNDASDTTAQYTTNVLQRKCTTLAGYNRSGKESM